MTSSKTRSAYHVSQSAPSGSPMKEAAERRGGRRRARELTCETCGKVYKHPVCLQKHRWEHNPLWRETAQFLLSKHQQVQVMEAAAILVHGSSLPGDRSLWPSYMSGGTLASPSFAADSGSGYRASSPSPTISSVDREDPPASQFDDEELDNVSEEEDDDDEKTDESDSPPSAFSYAYLNAQAANRSRGRSHSVGVAAASSTHMTGTYGWGVISESGQSRSTPFGGKSPVSEHLPYSPVLPSPMAIPTAAGRTFPGHQSMSSFGSIAHSFGSSSASSYIPSSSIRGRGEDDEETMKIDNNLFNFTSLKPQFPLETRREDEFDELEMEMD